MAKFWGEEYTRQDVLNALSQFDQDFPDTSDYDFWLDKENYKYAIKHGERLYPPKKILSIMTGIGVQEGLHGGNPTNRVFKALGFTLMGKS